MQELIASVDHIKFDLELAVEQQLGAQPLPFPGMDSACGRRARPFLPGVRGRLCPCPGVVGGFPGPVLASCPRVPSAPAALRGFASGRVPCVCSRSLCQAGMEAKLRRSRE